MLFASGRAQCVMSTVYSDTAVRCWLGFEPKPSWAGRSLSLRFLSMQETSFFFFSSRRRHTRCSRDWSSDVCSSDLNYSNESLTARQGHVKSAIWLGQRFGFFSAEQNQFRSGIQIAAPEGCEPGGEIGRASCRERV